MGVRKTETALIVWSEGNSAPAAAAERVAGVAQPTRPLAGSAEPLFSADAFFDAGSQGCGEGPLDKIAATLRKMDSGQTMEVRATDPSVAIDLPAWCRLVGHALVEQRDDRYLIRRK